MTAEDDDDDGSAADEELNSAQCSWSREMGKYWRSGTAWDDNVCQIIHFFPHMQQENKEMSVMGLGDERCYLSPLRERKSKMNERKERMPAPLLHTPRLGRSAKSVLHLKGAAELKIRGTL